MLTCVLGPPGVGELAGAEPPGASRPRFLHRSAMSTLSSGDRTSFRFQWLHWNPVIMQLF